jgi:hypothetical protein
LQVYPLSRALVSSINERKKKPCFIYETFIHFNCSCSYFSWIVTYFANSCAIDNLINIFGILSKSLSLVSYLYYLPTIVSRLLFNIMRFIGLFLVIWCKTTFLLSPDCVRPRRLHTFHKLSNCPSAQTPDCSIWKNICVHLPHILLPYLTTQHTGVIFVCTLALDTAENWCFSAPSTDEVLHFTQHSFSPNSFAVLRDNGKVYFSQTGLWSLEDNVGK